MAGPPARAASNAATRALPPTAASARVSPVQAAATTRKLPRTTRLHHRPRRGPMRNVASRGPTMAPSVLTARTRPIRGPADSRPLGLAISITSGSAIPTTEAGREHRDQGQHQKPSQRGVPALGRHVGESVGHAVKEHAVKPRRAARPRTRRGSAGAGVHDPGPAPFGRWPRLRSDPAGRRTPRRRTSTASSRGRGRTCASTAPGARACRVRTGPRARGRLPRRTACATRPSGWEAGSRGRAAGGVAEPMTYAVRPTPRLPATAHA